MPLDNLFDLLWSFVEQVFPVALPDIHGLHYAVRITTGVEYSSDLFDRGLDPAQMPAFQARVQLPRFVGVVAAHWEGESLGEFLVDVTAIDRVAGEASLLAVVAPAVAVRSATWKVLGAFCATVNVPLITGPRSAQP
jgi:hypothetical protein